MQMSLISLHFLSPPPLLSLCVCFSLVLHTDRWRELRTSSRFFCSPFRLSVPRQSAHPAQGRPFSIAHSTFLLLLFFFSVVIIKKSALDSLSVCVRLLLDICLHHLSPFSLSLSPSTPQSAFHAHHCLRTHPAVFFYLPVHNGLLCVCDVRAECSRRGESRRLCPSFASGPRLSARRSFHRRRFLGLAHNGEGGRGGRRERG